MRYLCDWFGAAACSGQAQDLALSVAAAMINRTTGEPCWSSIRPGILFLTMASKLFQWGAEVRVCRTFCPIASGDQRLATSKCEGFMNISWQKAADGSVRLLQPSQLPSLHHVAVSSIGELLARLEKRLRGMLARRSRALKVLWTCNYCLMLSIQLGY